MRKVKTYRLSLSARWQLKRLRMRASDCTDKPKNLILTPLHHQKLRIGLFLAIFRGCG